MSVFQLLTEGIRDGKKTVAGEAIAPGNLVRIGTSGSPVYLATSTTVHGIAFGDRTQTYRPQSRTFAAGETIPFVWGHFEALFSSDYFVGSSLPSAGASIYSAGSGLLATSGTVRVGTVLRIVSATIPTGGVGQSQSLAHVRIDITA